MVLLVLQVLLEVLALLGALVGLGSIKPKAQMVQMAVLHLPAQTIIMWHLGILMEVVQEHITTTITRRYILTVMGT
jgi:hypothetical protein